MSATCRSRQPRRQRFQVVRHRPEPLRLGLRRPAHRRRQHARHHALLVHVQPGTPFQDDVHVILQRHAHPGRSDHRAPRRGTAGGGRLVEILPRVLTPARTGPGNSSWCRAAASGPSSGTGLSHQTCAGLTPRPTLIFIVRGAAKQRELLRMTWGLDNLRRDARLAAVRTLAASEPGIGSGPPTGILRRTPVLGTPQ